VFKVNGSVQEVEVLDGGGEEAFSGPMADKTNPRHVGAPMPGLVDKVRGGWGAC
jgi:pyruvate carboxylase